MSFTDLLKNGKAKEVPQELVTESKDEVNEAPKKPEEVLRGAGFKIKMVTPTSFGTQIDFAKSYNPDEIKKELKDFNIKIKGKSVFIVD